ncbi:MAG: hypothetical protein HC896_00445 [Bacteroidales bacterium]|nr:hypothetical protein [Bacteroidales bacterium]
MCVSYKELVKTDNNSDCGVMTFYQYQHYKKAGWFRSVKHVCFGNSAMYDFRSVPEKFKKLLVEKYGYPKKEYSSKTFKEKITPDTKAVEYFTSHTLGLKPELVAKYCNDAAILNAVGHVWEASVGSRAKLGKGRTKGFWQRAIDSIKEVGADYPNTLPLTEKNMRNKFRSYQRDGYPALLSKKLGNDNSRKVTDDIERLLLSIYTMPNKPYATGDQDTSVHKLYMDFIKGKIEVCDETTGEMFDRMQFMDKEGRPVVIGEKTVYNYLNMGLNRVAVDKKRTGNLEYNSTHRPHHHRHAPIYSLSKISLDDRDLPRLCVGGERVKAYYSYDVTSGCVIGKSYSRQKDKDLFVDCIRDMFRTISKHGFGVPLQVEVEHHIVNKFKDDLMKAGNIFPFVRWCNPGNSQEKRAEHFNRAKKYGIEKAAQTGIGRHYAKLEANRPKTNYGEKTKYYEYEEVVSDDLRAIDEYNHQMHPNQKKYPGKTRWQVLVRHVNPDVANINKATLCRFIGNTTETSIRRSQYCKVKNNKYQIPSAEILDKLLPNNLTVQAYWLPDDEGGINEVYLYQGGNFICRANRLISYNEATAEQTDADRQAYTEQASYVAQFDKIVKERVNKIAKPGIVKAEDIQIIQKIADSPVEIVDIIEQTADDYKDYLTDYSPEAMRRLAIEQL